MLANLENSAVATKLEKSVFIPIPRKGNTKECSNYRIIVLISQNSSKFSKSGFNSMWNCELPDVEAGIRKGRGTRDQIANNLRYADDTTLMAESEEELKSFLMKVKQEIEKAGLKLNILKMKIMASSPITSWQIDRETMGPVTDFIFLGSKISADGDCSHDIKRYLLLGRKAMTNLDSVLESKRHSFAYKVPSSQSYGLSVVMYRCESWTIMKAEHRRMDAFEL